MDDFFRIINLNKKEISILINKNDTPFVLPDSGIILFKSDQTLNHKFTEAVLPITPSLALKFSNKQTNSEISLSEVLEINRLSFEESFQAIFSNKENYLKTFLRSS